MSEKALPRTIDLRLEGTPKALGAHWFDGVIVDPGPESTIDRLLEGLDGAEPRAILLTHIHFDHAGASGSLLERFPDAELWVHERGAPHLVDPTRLVASARKVFGERFDRLWGKVVPVPEDRVRILEGGEEIGPWRVAYTPGHAKHHVSYLHEPSGVAFTGDVAGIRVDGGPAFPPTPPPDIDVEAWHASLDAVAAWEPRALAYMHFGVTTEDPAEQLAQMHRNLDMVAGLAKELDAAAMEEWIGRWITEEAGAQARPSYEVAGPFGDHWPGLHRYWTKRAEREAAGD